MVLFLKSPSMLTLISLFANLTVFESVREAVKREREKSDQEKERQLRQEREDSKRRLTDVMSQLDREKNASRELNSDISNLKKELDEQRRLQREASKEKLAAVARTKEQMKDQSHAELDRIKFNLEQEHQRDVERLEEKLRYQEDELATLKTEHDQIAQRERNVLMALEHAEKTVIKEINEECEKVSGILGVSPRTVHHTSFHLESAEGRMSPSFRNRPVINSALANLRACSDELHNHILELQQEVESLKVMVETVTKEKEAAIENCKLQMEKQRTLDLEKLKDKLLKLEIDAVNTSQTLADHSFLYPSFNDSFGFDLSIEVPKDQLESSSVGHSLPQMCQII
ncbi:myosin-11-like isoform X2 [Elysia marginata]|uniref:Myosin-11-like isoform X2 n=1 Tax=Elysia marginata TaxID=1093978 RepID=A0AAV4HCQ0_9GAST|nr:myosin-11-like isoform X2 [Elysia marginata]